GAAIAGIGSGARLHRRGIAKRAGRTVGGVTIDRCGPNLGQGPGNRGGVFSRTGDAVVSAKEKDGTADAEYDRQCTDRRKEAHASLRPSMWCRKIKVMIPMRNSEQTKRLQKAGHHGPIEVPP